MQMAFPPPYKGDKPYIFISYSHRDSECAQSIIARLQADGYRVWYDDGVNPGSQWDDNIAHHIEQCGFFFALISANYLESSNCRDELNFACDLEKHRLMIYLEDVQLPSGLQMRLGRLRAIHKYRYSRETRFYEVLYDTPGLRKCSDKGAASAAGHVSRAPVRHGTPDKSEYRRKALLVSAIVAMVLLLLVSALYIGHLRHAGNTAVVQEPVQAAPQQEPEDNPADITPAPVESEEPEETPPEETPPEETPPAETPPAETPPVETPPVETPPPSTPPAETPPAETPPAEEPATPDEEKEEGPDDNQDPGTPDSVSE